MAAVAVSLYAAAAAGAPCSLYGGCTWDRLPFKCTRPALDVDYAHVTHYSG
eukprot:gene1866-14452_t